MKTLGDLLSKSSTSFLMLPVSSLLCVGNKTGRQDYPSRYQQSRTGDILGASGAENVQGEVQQKLACSLMKN